MELYEIVWLQPPSEYLASLAAVCGRVHGSQPVSKPADVQDSLPPGSAQGVEGLFRKQDNCGGRLWHSGRCIQVRRWCGGVVMEQTKETCPL